MAIDAFIPEVWSARLRRKLDATLVYASPTSTNRNYEGEITDQGDTVHVFQIGAGGTIKTYTPNVDMDAPEAPDGTEGTLVIDQSKYYNIGLDDVNRVQAIGGLLEAWAARTARNFAALIDGYVSGKMIAAMLVGNVIGTDAVPVTVKADGSGTYTPYEFFVALRKKLQAQNAPMDGRWAVIDEDLEAELLLDSKYIAVAGEETRNGIVGRIAGFSISVTTAVPTSPGSGGAPVAHSLIIAGAGNEATTVAHQLTKTVAYNPERRFADAIKGLEVYGAKVFEPETLVMGRVSTV